MARIRSLHPSQWTDEEFVALSPWARLLCLAIRNEADDQGIFEWKPLALKMRLFPADDIDVMELLGELERHKHVERYEVSGRGYGIIRNFTRFQRPKSPNSIHPKPLDFRSPSEPIPPNGEKSPQMKEEGGSKEKEIEATSVASIARDPLEVLERKLREAAGWENEPSPNLFVTGPIQSLIDAGAVLELDVLPVIRATAPKVRGRSSWKYFIGPIQDAMRDRLQARAPPISADVETKRSQAERVIAAHLAKVAESGKQKSA